MHWANVFSAGFAAVNGRRCRRPVMMVLVRGLFCCGFRQRVVVQTRRNAPRGGRLGVWRSRRMLRRGRHSTRETRADRGPTQATDTQPTNPQNAEPSTRVHVRQATTHSTAFPSPPGACITQQGTKTHRIGLLAALCAVDRAWGGPTAHDKTDEHATSARWHTSCGAQSATRAGSWGPQHETSAAAGPTTRARQHMTLLQSQAQPPHGNHDKELSQVQPKKSLAWPNKHCDEPNNELRRDDAHKD
ncbi:MAG: hypothetical protein RL701_3678 [Pseudomonadota bacterium]|jgi:hypothetical protein